MSVGAYFVEVGMDQSAEGVDVSHGNTSWKQRNAGLFDDTFSVMLTYDISNLSTYIAKLARGSKYVLDFGPEGNTAGKPRQTQSVLLTKMAGPKLTVKKDHVTFQLTFESADAPSNDIFASATF